ncbi:MAG: hypothetical protein ACTTME_01510 [Arsenophonus sp.]
MLTHEFSVYDKVIKLFCSQQLEYLDIRRNHKYIYKQISKKILSSAIEYLAIIFLIFHYFLCLTTFMLTLF